MEFGLGVGDRVPDRAIITRGVALAEIIALNVCIVCADEFPIYFVEIVALEHDAGAYALARGGAHEDFDFAAEDMEAGGDGGGVEGLGDGEGGAGGGVVDGFCGDVPGGGGEGGVCEGEGVGGGEGGVGGTGGVEGVAGCEGLG